MDFNTTVQDLLQVFLDKRTDLFLVDLKITPDYSIVVTLDGDQGVTIQDCLDASRSIENNLDREDQDFALQVASYGATQPLIMQRQYVKNIGRELEVTREDDSLVTGEIIAADEQQVTLEYSFRQAKEIGKGKVTVTEQQAVLYTDIKKAVIQIKF
jgi:ribosome maturation factor RimP